MLKKFMQVILAVFLLLFLVKPVLAQNNQVNLYFFWSKTCPHCADEADFLQKIQPAYPHLKIHDFEVGSTQENISLLRNLGETLKVDVNGVPMTFIGDEYFVGYMDDDTTGKEIISLVNKFEKEGDPNVVGRLIYPDEVGLTVTPDPTSELENDELTPTPVETKQTINLPDEINVPLIGLVSIKSLSLPVLTFVIALLDGFNPCAMWVLLFLISMLLGMKDRKKMWILGTVFILASGFVYFLFLSAWLNLFLFLGFVVWVRILVGIIALVMGVYQLRDYWINKDGACKVGGDEKRRKVFDKIKEITHREQLLVAIFGMILLAFAVNLVELVCSAGLPAIYTQILSITELPRWQHYAYLVFYIFVFMVDDLIVFVIAMTTLHAVGIDSKFSRLSRLIGGTLIFLIGLLMLFAPELLMFGG